VDVAKEDYSRIDSIGRTTLRDTVPHLEIWVRVLSEAN